MGPIRSRQVALSFALNGSAVARKLAWPPKKTMVVHPPLNFFLKWFTMHLIGVKPRHRPHHLSLLPSGPDEIHDRLLRGVRSDGSSTPGSKPREGIQPRIKRISGKGHR